MTRCKHDSCSFYCGSPGELADHEIVHEPWYREPLTDKALADGARRSRAFLDVLAEREREREFADAAARAAALAGAFDGC